MQICISLYQQNKYNMTTAQQLTENFIIEHARVACVAACQHLIGQAISIDIKEEIRDICLPILRKIESQMHKHDVEPFKMNVRVELDPEVNHCTLIIKIVKA